MIALKQSKYNLNPLKERENSLQVYCFEILTEKLDKGDKEALRDTAAPSGRASQAQAQADNKGDKGENLVTTSF